MGGLRLQRNGIENEALRLFEFGVEEEFRRRGNVVLDSSLGLLPVPRRATRKARKAPGNKH